MRTTTVTISSIPVTNCSSLQPTDLIFITIPNCCDHAINLCNDNLTTNYNLLKYQPICIYFSDGNTPDLHLSIATILSLLSYVSPLSELSIYKNHCTWYRNDYFQIFIYIHFTLFYIATKQTIILN